MDKKLIGLDLTHIADAVGNIAAYLKEQLADQKHITVLA